MSDTKLSNTYGLDTLIEKVPRIIDNCMDELHKEVKKIKDDSLYYSEMSAVGMITCIVLILLGGLIVFFPNILEEYVVFFNGSVLWKVFGVFLLLVSVHEIVRMFFGVRVNSAYKKPDKMGAVFKNQYENAVNSLNEGNRLRNMIENFEDDELSEKSRADEKLFRAVSPVKSQDRVFSILVVISRIIIPIALLTGVCLFLTKDFGLGTMRLLWAFIAMFVFNARLCLLLEYKAGAIIRFLMCLPSVGYGALAYFSVRDEMQGMNFLPDTVLALLPEQVYPFIGWVFILCLIQVIVLILSVVFKDYYAEKKHIKEGVEGRDRDRKHKKWYIAYNVVLYFILAGAYAVALPYSISHIQPETEMKTILLTGAVFGLILRVISPIWPERIKKTIRKYWGARYSVAVDIFMIAVMFSLLILEGVTFSTQVPAMLVAVAGVDIIAFAIMSTVWRTY